MRTCPENLHIKTENLRELFCAALFSSSLEIILFCLSFVSVGFMLWTQFEIWNLFLDLRLIGVSVSKLFLLKIKFFQFWKQISSLKSRYLTEKESLNLLFLANIESLLELVTHIFLWDQWKLMKAVCTVHFHKHLYFDYLNFRKESLKLTRLVSYSDLHGRWVNVAVSELEFEPSRSRFLQFVSILSYHILKKNPKTST